MLATRRYIKLCSWSISSTGILINQQYHRLRWCFRCDSTRNPRRRRSLRWRRSSCRDDSDDHRFDRSSFHVRCSEDGWVRTFELATCPRERFLKRSRWLRRTDRRRVRQSWSVKLAIWMTIGLSRGWRSPTNAASPLISKLQCSSSLRCRARRRCDDGTCTDWLASCRDIPVRPRHPTILIPLSSSPSNRAALLYSYSPPTMRPCWSNWLSSDDDSLRRRSPGDWPATGMSLYLVKGNKLISREQKRKIIEITNLTAMAPSQPNYCNANTTSRARRYRGTAERTAFQSHSWSRRLLPAHSSGSAHACATWPDDS